MNTTLTGPTSEGRAAAHLGPEHRRFVRAQRALLDHYGITARSRYLELERPRMRAHALDVGSGEPFVVLHGGDGQAVDWAPLMAELQHDVRMVAVDRPAFGLSDPFDYRTTDLRRHAADFVTSVLDALDLESATLVAGSMGGFFALSTALDRPERVRRLIFVGMPLGISRTCPLPFRLLCGVPGLTRLVMMRTARSGIEARRKQYVKMFSVDLAKVPDIYFEMQAAGMAMPGAMPTWVTLLRRIAGLRGIRREVVLEDELVSLRAPPLLIWPEHDMIPAAEGRSAAERMPSARCEVLEGVGHFPFLEAPRDCARLIRDAAGIRPVPTGSGRP
jgi:pimeloyl-ACP methyl ester carboxylesterase